MMPSIRIVLVVGGLAVLPVSLGNAPLGASEEVHDPDRFLTTSIHDAMTPTLASAGSTLDHLARRLDSLDEGIRDLRELAIREVQPLARVLVQSYSAEPEFASRIAVGLVREGRRTGTDPRLLLAVLLVENPWLDPEVRSFVGAVGLMQVMPFHAGEWDCSGSDLTDPDINICHGARILAHAIKRSEGDVDRALLRYNGCVRGTNTPDCHRYPEWVRARMARVEAEFLVDD
jgi:soluble lytic murein transglycosylase-like protein